MILMGLVGAVAQLTKGRALRTDFAQVYAATAQTAASMPHVENARAETRPVAGRLDATFREILAQADKPGRDKSRCDGLRQLARRELSVPRQADRCGHSLACRLLTPAWH